MLGGLLAHLVFTEIFHCAIRIYKYQAVVFMFLKNINRLEIGENYLNMACIINNDNNNISLLMSYKNR